MKSLITILSKNINEGLEEVQDHNKKFIFNYLNDKTKGLEQINTGKLEGYVDVTSGFFLLGYLGDFFMDSWTYHDINDKITYLFPIVDWLMEKFGRDKGEIIVDYATDDFEKQIKNVFKFAPNYSKAIRLTLNETNVFALYKAVDNIVFFSKENNTALVNLVNNNRIIFHPNLVAEISGYFDVNSRRGLVIESFDYLIKLELMKLFKVDLGSKVSSLGAFDYDYVSEHGQYLGEGKDILPKQ
jgi:hypothetical protein